MRTKEQDEHLKFLFAKMIEAERKALSLMIDSGIAHVWNLSGDFFVPCLDPIKSYEVKAIVFVKDSRCAEALDIIKKLEPSREEFRLFAIKLAAEESSISEEAAAKHVGTRTATPPEIRFGQDVSSLVYTIHKAYKSYVTDADVLIQQLREVSAFGDIRTLQRAISEYCVSSFRLSKVSGRAFKVRLKINDVHTENFTFGRLLFVASGAPGAAQCERPKQRKTRPRQDPLLTMKSGESVYLVDAPAVRPERPTFTW